MGTVNLVSTDAEFDKVWAILALSVAEPSDRQREHLRAQYLQGAGAQLWVLRHEGMAIGVIGIRPRPDRSDAGEIMHIGVATSHQRHGLGRQMAYALKVLRPNVRTWFAETDEHAVDFYRALGCEVEDLGALRRDGHRYRCALRT